MDSNYVLRGKGDNKFMTSNSCYIRKERLESSSFGHTTLDGGERPSCESIYCNDTGLLIYLGDRSRNLCVAETGSESKTFRLKSLFISIYQA